MKTIEEKAKAYATNHATVPVFYKPDVKVDISKHVHDAFLAGATEALSGQWHGIDEQPPEGKDIAIYYEANDLTGKRGRFKCIIKYHAATGFAYLEEAMKSFDVKVIAWMPLPEPPKDES